MHGAVVPSARTKKVVFEVGLTVTELPVPICVPPQLPLYQTKLAPVPKLPPTLVRVTDPPLHTGFVDALIEVGAVEGWITVIVICAHVVFPVHGPEAISARTKKVVVLVGLTTIEFPLPSGVPPQLPLYHSNVALVPREPPTLVKVTLLPLQIVSFAATVMLVGAVEGISTVTNFENCQEHPKVSITETLKVVVAPGLVLTEQLPPSGMVKQSNGLAPTPTQSTR